MRRGTPGFNGTRLREARETRGMTITQLAELAGVSHQMVSAYEHGNGTPNPELLRTIAGVVKVSPEFFLMPSREDDRGTIFYRSMSTATKGARARAERRLRWVRDISTLVQEEVQLPQPNFPTLMLPDDPLQISAADIEEAASELRDHWALRDAPIANAVRLVENQGGVVSRDRLGAQSLDSLSEWVTTEHRPYVSVGTDKGTPARWRFDVAHELGHLILHAHVSPNDVAKKETHKLIEQQANLFAGAFLLPLAAFSDDLFGANLDAFEAIKPKWKVAISAMIMRARRADLIDDDRQRQLMVAMSRKGWRKQEPYDDTMETEQPLLLRRGIELMVEHGRSTDDIVGALGVQPHDIETLAALEPGYLGDTAPVTYLGPSGRRVSEPEDEPPTLFGSGTVVQFPRSARE